MTKHTEGPWKVEGPFGVAQGGGKVLEIGAETGAGHLSVATVGFNEPDAEGQAACRADANLIAAAPELKEAANDGLHALKHVLDCIDEGEDFVVDTLKAAHSALKAAIAKAEGTR